MAEALIPTKPYLIRAIHEWCVDNNLTPHLLVEVSSQTLVPMQYVKDGEIVLNLNHGATKDLHIDNEQITFSARFNGVSQHLFVPIGAVKGIFARENGQGMFFEINNAVHEDVSELDKSQENQDSSAGAVVELKNKVKKPTLTIVK